MGKGPTDAILKLGIICNLHLPRLTLEDIPLADLQALQSLSLKELVVRNCLVAEFRRFIAGSS